MKDKKGEAKAPKPTPTIPQCTFEESEVVQLADYFNLINKYAKFEGMGPQEIQKFAGLQAGFARHIKKCEEHIFEFKRTIKAGEEA